MKVCITTDYMDKQRTGIGNYTKCLVKSLLESENCCDIDLYAVHYTGNPDPLYQKLNEIFVPMLPVPPRKVLTNILRFSKSLEGIDLVHVTAPNPSDNLGIILSKNIKKVLTIHDLCIFSNPMLPKVYTSPSTWALHKTWKSTLKYAVKKVDMIISISENTKTEIIDYLNIPEERITVIYLAADERFKILENISSDSPGHPFILCDSSAQSGVIKAFYKLKKKGIKQKLLIFGGMSRSARIDREGMIKELGLEEEVHLLGYVSDEKLVELYNLADLFIFPSYICEGFGIPPLEAMACGTPVITGRVGTMQEVLGDAALNADLFNVDESAEVIYSVLADEDLKNDLIRKGLKRSKMYSYEKTAKKTVEVYRKVYGD